MKEFWSLHPSEIPRSKLQTSFACRVAASKDFMTTSQAGWIENVAFALAESTSQEVWQEWCSMKTWKLKTALHCAFNVDFPNKKATVVLTFKRMVVNARFARKRWWQVWTLGFANMEERKGTDSVLIRFCSATRLWVRFAWFCDFNLGLRLHESAASFTILAASHSQQRGICMIAFVICLFCWIVTYCNIASTATSKAFWDCSKGSYQSKSNLLANQPLAGTHCHPHPTTHHHPSLMIFDSCASGQTSKLAS